MLLGGCTLKMLHYVTDINGHFKAITFFVIVCVTFAPCKDYLLSYCHQNHQNLCFSTHILTAVSKHKLLAVLKSLISITL